MAAPSLFTYHIISIVREIFKTAILKNPLFLVDRRKFVCFFFYTDFWCIYFFFHESKNKYDYGRPRVKTRLPSTPLSSPRLPWTRRLRLTTAIFKKKIFFYIYINNIFVYTDPSRIRTRSFRTREIPRNGHGIHNATMNIHFNVYTHIYIYMHIFYCTYVKILWRDTIINRTVYSTRTLVLTVTTWYRVSYRKKISKYLLDKFSILRNIRISGHFELIKILYYIINPIKIRKNSVGCKFVRNFWISLSNF